MTLKEFLAEIQTTFSNYTESGDIDNVSIKMWVIHCLRQMGNNITTVNEAVLTVRNSQVLLPETFKSLKLALKLEPECEDLSQGELESYIYKQRIENEAYYNPVTHEYETNGNSKIITEKIFLNNDVYTVKYTPTWLSLVKGIKKDSLDTDCMNLHPSIRNSYPHEISINARTLQANFKEGKIYVQYNSLYTEDDEVAIPEISTGDLYHYIECYCKVKIAENLILNNKNPTGVSQLLSMWEAKLSTYKHAAMSECRFASLNNSNWQQKFKALNRRTMMAFELPKH
jgi:hypothetical protein